jgi:hypothetical protein
MKLLLEKLSESKRKGLLEMFVPMLENRRIVWAWSRCAKSSMPSQLLSALSVCLPHPKLSSRPRSLVIHIRSLGERRRNDEPRPPPLCMFEVVMEWVGVRLIEAIPFVVKATEQCEDRGVEALFVE